MTMTEQREQYLYRLFGQHVRDAIRQRDDFFFTEVEVDEIRVPQTMEQKAKDLGFEPGPFFRLQLYVDERLYWLVFRMEGDELIIGVLVGPDNAEQSPDSLDFEERTDWSDDSIRDSVWEAVNYISDVHE